MSRFKDERERTGFQQGELADLINVTRRTISRWENEETPIPSDKLTACAEFGFDVMYILTGQRAAPLTPEEAALLDNYRNSPPEAQAAIRSTGAAFAQRQSKKVSGDY